ncbi:O-antigen ligase family protein [Brevibacillus sp. 179-C9.3 HS]|uniref:O-antigen ligase family protein n=1 Tax=unclassified Brevibacillus TaxID=2684853 RepID=UPI00399F2C46
MNTSCERRSSRTLNLLVFLYIFSSLVLTAVPVISRTSLLLAMTMGICLLLQYIHSGDILIPKWILLPLLFLLYAVTSVWWAADPAGALLSAFILLSAAGGGLFLLIALLSGASWNAVVYACFFSGLTLVLTTVPELATLETNTRLSGILGNPNGLAINLTVTALVLFTATKRKLLFTLTGIGFIVFATIVSGSIKMLLFWAIFLCFVTSRLFKWSTKSYLHQSMLYVIALMVIAIPLYVGNVLVENFEHLTVTKRFVLLLSGENNSGNSRMEMFHEALDLWERSPLFGNGIDQVRVLGSHGTYSHNNYAEMLADFGLIGATLYYLILGMFLWIGLANLFSPHRQYHLVLLISITTLVWDFALVSYYEKSSWLLMAFSFYLIWQVKQQKQEAGPMKEGE